MILISTLQRAFLGHASATLPVPCQRVDTTRVAKAIGSPSMLHGVDIVGASSTNLHSVRVAVLCAALPPGASRNVDVAFAVLDAGCGDWQVAVVRRGWPCGRCYRHGVAPRLDLFLSAAILDDAGKTVGFLLMPPAMASAAVHRSADRWRTKRVISMIPPIAASTLELPTDAGADSFTAFARRPLARLLKGQGRPHSTVPQCSAPCRSMLLSAATGGQWPQVRLARLRNADVVDLTCQLCGEAPGTLLHRRCCAASLPPEGWPEPPSARSDLLSALPEARGTLLRTRGLLALRLPRPVAQQELAARWFPAPPDETRRPVLVHGWVDEHPHGLAILTTAAASTLQATQPTRMLAQLWSRVSALLDGDTSELLVAGRLTWMPAHGSVASIGTARRSDGHVVTAVDWRANHLADAAANAAAGCPPECAAGAQLFGQAECLVAHEGAVLGAVTHAANNHVRELVGPGGAVRRVTVRDAAAMRS
ncbi:unnamed protein product, partial [Prorocentrum cordatum]